MGAVPAAILFAALAALVAARWHPLVRVDRDTALALNDWVTDGSGRARWWRWLSDAGGPAVVRILLAVVAVVLLRVRRYRAAVFCAAVSLGSLLLVTVVKDSVDRPRPVVPHPVASAAGASFPSGHALTAAAGALAVVIVTARMSPARRRVLRGAALLLAAAIGFSRLVLGVHYLSDVVGGFLGATVLVLVLDVVVLTRAPGDDSG